MRKLALFAGAFALGIFLAQYLPGTAWQIPAAAGCFAAALLALALPSPGRRRGLIALCALSMAFGWNWLYIRQVQAPLEALNGKGLGEALLAPTRIYVRPVLALLEKVDVKGISHITGGGFYENIPRSIPDGLCAKIRKSAVPVLPIFDLIAKTGNIPERDMFNTFNMGIGMTITVPAAQVEEALAILKEQGEEPVVLGEIVRGDEKVVLV